MELTIAIAVFSQIIVMVGGTVMSALELDRFNRSIKGVNTELYGMTVNGIGAYIRKATGIMYDDHPLATANNVGTITHTQSGIEDLDRACDEENIFETDQLTLFQDKEKTHYITFAVEKDDILGTSRVVWRKDDGAGHSLTSEDTYITCFLITPSPNPYSDSNINAKDLQPYVQLYVAAKHRFTNEVDVEDRAFNDDNQIAYKTTFSLRNYYY